MADRSDQIEATLQGLSALNPEALLLPGYDQALVGFVESSIHSDKAVAVYHKEKIIEILMINDNISEEDALDHYSYNIAGSYVGENTPIFLSFFTDC